MRAEKIAKSPAIIPKPLSQPIGEALFPIKPSALPSPLPALVPMPGEMALVQKSVCHHRAHAASYDTLTDRIPHTTSLRTSLSHTTQYTPLQIHLHLFPSFSLLHSCGQPADRAYAAVSHNCSIFTLHTYTTHTQTRQNQHHFNTTNASPGG